jgi:hypothetical protein
MNDVDMLLSSRSSTTQYKNKIQDIDSLDSRTLNQDEPKPSISPSRDLIDTIRNIDNEISRYGNRRLPMRSSTNIASVRIIPDTSRRSSNSASSYRPPETRKIDINISDDEKAYMYRLKFQRLNARNPTIPMPDTNDASVLERLYHEAIRTDHYCSSTSTWLIYMGLGYGAFQYVLSRFSISLPSNFVVMQMEVMSCYPQLLKALGDPGGPSLGSSWPPWLKLIFVICVHTFIFVLIYKMTGSADSAHNTQKFICRTGLMGGKPNGEEVAVDNATSGITGMLGGLFGGGLGNMMQTFLGGIGNNTNDIDIENPPMPVSTRDEDFLPTEKTPFDE